MMIKKIFSVFCMLFITVTLYACQLAKPDGAGMENRDRFVGVYMTSYRLDLHLNQQEPGSYYDQIVFAADDPYNGRIYAVLGKNEIGDETYIFEGLNGVSLFMYLSKSDNPFTNGWNYVVDNSVIHDSHVSFIENNRSIEGTVYTIYNSGFNFEDDSVSKGILYINPVFQSGDGRIYLKASFVGRFNIDGSETLTETYTFSENGKTVEDIFSVKINYSVKNPSAKISVISMNAENEEISREEYTDLTLPESITLASDAEYVVIEKRTPSSDGEILSREIYSRGALAFISYRAGEDGFFLEIVPVHLFWK